ncbi:MAG TPA: T9SS type A sorting domain-containing protein [Bacteroidia bacterium]|nr:T9SS type A sorting domain-containing protein [Bacteroidia bacterium]
MKRQLFLTAALCTSICAFPQSGKMKPESSGKENTRPLMKLQMNEPAATAASQNGQSGANNQTTQSAKTSTFNNWVNFSTSPNIYGVLISYCNPLGYNNELNAVSFVHRKPTSYVASPAPAATAASGLMIASISSNWGNNWDSTLIWNDDNNWGRYPGGGIYNPPGNSTLSAAYIVGHGPTTAAAGGWPGNFYASKQLNAFTNVASTTPGAQQWKDITNPDPNIGRHDFAAYAFNASDDGKVRCLAGITDDAAGQDTAVMMITGTFNSGVFAYSGTVFNPPATFQSDGSDNWVSRPAMAWNDLGTVGYVAVMGSRIGASGCNVGLQPMVWKTTNSGASWALLPGIDFNSASYTALKHNLTSVTTSTLEVPNFLWLEGFDMSVDANNKLHLFSVPVGHYSDHVDSLFYTAQFGSEGYRWLHIPGLRPYLYDFMTDGTAGWSYITVDSMSTEGPAGLSTGNGFNVNPWDLNGSDKPRLDARLQTSRTPDGKFIFYSWTESDTNFTSSAVKWNVLPNIKVRAYSVDNNTVFPQEINISSPTTGANPNVASRAFFHYMSSISSNASTLTAPGTSTAVAAKLPFTVTNSQGYTQLISNTHWFDAAELTFYLGAPPAWVSISENAMEAAETSMLYPNPATNSTQLALSIKEETRIGIAVYNLMGQMVKAFVADGQKGENQINIDLNGLERGVYMVKVNVGNASSTKKLIVE